MSKILVFLAVVAILFGAEMYVTGKHQADLWYAEHPTVHYIHDRGQPACEITQDEKGIRVVGCALTVAPLDPNHQYDAAIRIYNTQPTWLSGLTAEGIEFGGESIHGPMPGEAHQGGDK